jgi:hypothetical protein
MQTMLAGVLPSSSSLKLALTPRGSGRAEAGCNALFAESHGDRFQHQNLQSPEPFQTRPSFAAITVVGVGELLVSN